MLSALLATNQMAAVTNLVKQKIGISVAVTDPNDPVAQWSAGKTMRETPEEFKWRIAYDFYTLPPATSSAGRQ